MEMDAYLAKEFDSVRIENADRQDLFFEYANSSLANRLDEDDHSQMVLFELGAKCSNPSLQLTADNLVSCNDLCSSDSQCNYASYDDSAAGEKCILTTNCTMERQSKVEQHDWDYTDDNLITEEQQNMVEKGKNYSIYIKSSYLQYVYENGLEEEEERIKLEEEEEESGFFDLEIWDNNKYLFIIIIISIIIILFIFSRRRVIYLY
ncbi:MAG: hypothetical protein CMB64_05045 [Euryarchaeota archaeon]|nr:hypothetical protein [Euryarchaeota archaeon]|tara:strand:- start:176 stop:793 length:618 start_codon:yes stop_codon:yes gene_type:complete